MNHFHKDFHLKLNYKVLWNGIIITKVACIDNRLGHYMLWSGFCHLQWIILSAYTCISSVARKGQDEMPGLELLSPEHHTYCHTHIQIVFGNKAHKYFHWLWNNPGLPFIITDVGQNRSFILRQMAGLRQWAPRQVEPWSGCPLQEELQLASSREIAPCVLLLPPVSLCLFSPPHTSRYPKNAYDAGRL